MTDAEIARRPGHAAARTLWLFQAFVAGLLSILWILDILREIDHPSYGSDGYPASKDLLLAILAAIIMYTVIVQWQYSDPHPKIIAKFELAKGLLATVIWLWVLLDAIFYIPSHPYYYDPYCRYRAVRIKFSAISIAIPCIFFYPTMLWSARVARRAIKQDTAIDDGTAAGENTPLLRGG
ncbi:hypothetical protein N8I77_005735 [Diaporthe amygdali]|uniref:Uncharacterized protein n=1 Tax=Phomopsis amygdali TaxID=1214568 RepID=A0AAD9W394_PHOAM|nr:hypothetical protein N8I77_005735 [Diaporthe amygdali]